MNLTELPRPHLQYLTIHRTWSLDKEAAPTRPPHSVHIIVLHKSTIVAQIITEEHNVDSELKKICDTMYPGGYTCECDNSFCI